MGARKSFPPGPALPVDRPVSEISQEVSCRASCRPDSQHGTAAVNAYDRPSSRAGDRSAVDCRFQGSVDQDILFQALADDTCDRKMASEDGAEGVGRSDCGSGGVSAGAAGVPGHDTDARGADHERIRRL